MNRRLHIDISPCPNDTFIFHAMLHGLIDTEGLDFTVDFSDIDELNRLAASVDSKAEVVKVSYAALPELSSRFNLISSGGALGYGNGPIVVSRRKIRTEELSDMSIAIPGRRTTAARLLSVLFPQAANTRVYLFSDIADAVASGEVDAGVLIHEGRFTYRDKGLELISDLGQEWENRHNVPIPLGGIVISKAIDEYVAAKVARTIRRSVEFAFADPSVSEKFVREYAQELSEDVCRKHISYFVNDFSVDLGENGLRAVSKLLGSAAAEKIRLITGR